MELTTEQLKQIIDEAPEYCPITGLAKCESYTIEDNVVYLTNPAYDAYTLPSYDEGAKAFCRTKYDMDDDFSVTEEWLCDLDDLRDRSDFKEIKRFYNIIE